MRSGGELLPPKAQGSFPLCPPAVSAPASLRGVGLPRCRRSGSGVIFPPRKDGLCQGPRPVGTVKPIPKARRKDGPPFARFSTFEKRVFILVFPPPQPHNF